MYVELWWRAVQTKLDEMLTGLKKLSMCHLGGGGPEAYRASRYGTEYWSGLGAVALPAAAPRSEEVPPATTTSGRVPKILCMI